MTTVYNYCSEITVQTFQAEFLKDAELTVLLLLAGARVEALGKLKVRPDVLAFLPRLNFTTGTDVVGNVSVAALGGGFKNQGFVHFMFSLEAHQHHQVLQQEEGEQLQPQPEHVFLVNVFSEQCRPSLTPRLYSLSSNCISCIPRYSPEGSHAVLTTRTPFFDAETSQLTLGAPSVSQAKCHPDGPEYKIHSKTTTSTTHRYRYL